MKTSKRWRWGSVALVLALLFSLCGQAFAADEVSRLILSKNDLTLEIGDTYSITATAITVSGATDDVTIKTDWTSGTPSIASVYAGVITAKAEGTATITATYAGKTVVVNVNVEKKVRTLTKNKTSSSLRVGASDQISLVATYTDGTTANVTDKANWSTTNDSIASVNDGLITGVSSGSATINATYGSQNVSISVAVDSVRRLDLDQTDLIMKVGGTKQMKLMALFDNGDYEDMAEKAEWSSNKGSVADAFKGLITAYGTGQATITGKYGNKSVTVVVNVDVAKRLDMDKSDLFLKVNGTEQVKVTAVYADGSSEDVTSKATWTSDNEDVASVEKGNITGYSSGQTTINASYGGKTTTVSVDVETARKLEMKVSSVQLNTGDSYSAELTATYADGTTENVTDRAKWTSDKESVAYATKGTIKAISAGEAIVTAQFGSVTAKLVVDVDVARSLTVNKKTVSLRTGGTEQLTVTALRADSSKVDVTDQVEWSVDNIAAVKVTKGKIEALATGQAVVTAKYGDTTAVVTVQVEIPSKLELDVTDVFLKENNTKQLELTATFADGTSEKVTSKADWTSSNENNAIVTGGLIRSIKMGQATITASYGGKTATATVDVEVPRKISLNKTAIDLRTGVSEQLTVTAVYAEGDPVIVTDKAVWSIDNQDVAMVSKGNVTAYKSGSAVVTVTFGGKTATVQVAVDQATYLTANLTKISLQAGGTSQLTVTATYPNGQTEDVTQKVVWTSKTTSVAGVNKGLVTAIDRGATTITATYGDKTVSVSVTVGEVTGLTVSQNKLLLSEGQSAAITVTAAFKDGTSKGVTDDADWSSSQEKVAKVYGGVIRAISGGTATITVKYGDKTETVSVEVDMANRLSLNTKLLVMDKDGQAQLVLTATNSNNETETVTDKAQWKTNADKVADVDRGLVTAYSGGKATITATYGGKSVAVTVEVGVPQKLAFNKRLLSLKSGGSEALELTATYSDGSTRDVTSEAEWASSNIKVADVVNGVVTAIEYGKSTISAKYGGKRITIQLAIDELKYLKSADKKLTLSVEDTKQVSLIATYKDGVDAEVASQAMWKSSNDKVADVKDGLITAYGKGNAVVTARFAGMTVTVNVTVK
ncbi:Ig-like domain-containing protein [Paenibacillus thalictri]|uniref:Ig-like domain-containing protein n=1 Tax=Paenibacillus thalictri TaxID=2527873 RepID=UPI0013EF123A|nr:Ig-like domain-containing protein [Paenibacillus thalictri]